MVATPGSPQWEAVTLRPAVLADASVFAALATQLGYPSTAHQVEERMAALLDDPKHLILAAVSGGRVVGWAHAYVCCLVESDQYAELGGLVVDESHRGMGVGAKLLGKVEEWARQKDCCAVSVRSNVIRQEAHRFYSARGYAKIKTQHVFRKGL